MKRGALLVLAVGLGLYGLKLASDAALSIQAEQSIAEGEDPGEGGSFGLGGWGDTLTIINGWNPVQAVQQQVESYEVTQASESLNVRAWLAMIFHAEGTARSADPYRVCYGYRHTIQSFADHPAVTGEWRGEDISNLGPQYVGKVSTAAGAGQIRKATWLEAKAALRLPDFGPESQRKALVWLTKRRGALADVEAGNIARAIELCRGEWASLPGGSSGQPQRKLADLLKVYTNSGGYLA